MTRSITFMPDVLFHQFANEAIILNIRNETYYSMNSTATRMWEILNETQSVEKTVERMCKDYDVRPEDLQRDLDELINKLKEIEVIRVIET